MPPTVSAEIALPPVAAIKPPMLKVLLTAFARPLAVAVNCLFVPAVEHSRLEKATKPFPAAVPMSKVEEPSNEPEPEVKARLTLRLAGNPIVEGLPNAS